MKNNFYPQKTAKSNAVLRREIKALQKRYARKSGEGFNASYLFEIETAIRTKIAMLGNHVYTSFAYIKEPDEIGILQVVGFTSHGPAVKKFTDKGGVIRNDSGGIYFPTFNPPIERRFAA